MTPRRALWLAIVLLMTHGGRAWADTLDSCISAAEEGQRLQRRTKLAAARAKFLVCASESCPDPLAADCKTWLTEVTASLSTVVVRATDAQGKELDAVRVSVDGEPLADRLDGRPIEIDPGQRTLRYEAAGELVSQSIVIRQGERNRLVDVRFTHVNVRTPAAAKTAKTDAITIPASAWVLGATGLVLGGIGGALWIAGRGQRADLFDTCGKTRTCRESDEQGPRAIILFGDVAVITGLVAITTAVGITLFSSRTTKVAAGWTSGGALLGASGSF